MAATTHNITEKRDSKGSFFQCARCGKDSGASTKGQADKFMGVCQSDEAILETPADARYHEEKKAAKAEAINDMKATPRQIGYLEALLEKNPMTARELGIHGIPSNLSKSAASDLIEMLKN